MKQAAHPIGVPLFCVYANRGAATNTFANISVVYYNDYNLLALMSWDIRREY